MRFGLRFGLAGGGASASLGSATVTPRVTIVNTGASASVSVALQLSTGSTITNVSTNASWASVTSGTSTPILVTLSPSTANAGIGSFNILVTGTDAKGAIITQTIPVSYMVKDTSKSHVLDHGLHVINNGVMVTN